jgi:hypothetical protein
MQYFLCLSLEGIMKNYGKLQSGYPLSGQGLQNMQKFAVHAILTFREYVD